MQVLEMPHQSTDTETGAALDSVRRIVQALRISARRAEQELGVSGAQLFVLQKLAASDSPLSLSELSAQTRTHSSSVSVVVARLTESGFVIRAAAVDDGRRTEVRLSAKGRKFLQRSAAMTAQERLAKAIERLPKKRRTLLVDLLQEIIDTAGFRDIKATMFFEEDSSGGRIRRVGQPF